MIRQPSSLPVHLRASRYLLGCEPLREIHRFMDATAARYGAGHRLVRHDWATVKFMVGYYGAFDPSLRPQVEQETVLHIAIDKGLVTLRDIALMSDLVRIIQRRAGRRTLLNASTEGSFQPFKGNKTASSVPKMRI